MNSNGDANKLVYWILGALLTVSVAIGGINLAMTNARLDRIEASQDRAHDDRRTIDQRLNTWYGQLTERLARIEAKLE